MATLKLNHEPINFRIEKPAQESIDFNRIKVGKRVLANDAFIDPDLFGGSTQRRFTRDDIDRAMQNNEIANKQLISEHYYQTNGIYRRMCGYFASLYRYDWWITPLVFDDKIKDEKIIEGWYKASALLENSYLKEIFQNIALDVVVEGCYYGYIMPQPREAHLQKLPRDFCRSTMGHNGEPAVEFNVKYFDKFRDAEQRVKVLKLFDKEIQSAYVAYKKGNLAKMWGNDDTGWILLDPTKAVKFSLGKSDAPLLFSVVPAILDLEGAQDLDKKKMAQQILKLIIQTLPLDKNGDLIFDVEEAQQLHANAVNMLGEAIGVNVLTTFADTQVADLSDKGNVSSVDQLEKVERNVYNQGGTSQMLFNSTGNLALKYSIANDEATMQGLVLQFERLGKKLLAPFNKNPKRLEFKFGILPTTIYNYQDLSKIYKEQTSLGFSKLLPQIALGIPQSVIIATAYFENELMNLNELFVAPQMSSTISNKDANRGASTDDKGGRPPKSDEDKSEKTIANIESGSQQ